MREYTWPRELDIGYPARPEKRCGNCRNSSVTNAGANCPGRECAFLIWLAERMGIDNINPQIDSRWGTCIYHDVPLSSIEDLASKLWPLAEGAKES